MKTLQNTNLLVFSSFLKTIFAFWALLAICFSQVSLATGSPAPCAIQQKKGNAILLHLGETMSGYQTITVGNLIADEPGFSGTWWTANPTENMRSVLFTNISGAVLPANSEVALVTVNDPVYGFTRHFLLGTDGGSVVLILGDW